MEDPKKVLQSEFVDEQGIKSTVLIESMNIRPENKLPKGKYKIVENIKMSTNRYLDQKRKAKNILTMDIGIHSEGFAQIATLATIIAVATLTVLYIILKV